MGVLIIKRVSYSGDKYFYESPALNSGLNVVYGDNGSGKSTFSYFLEYALGGKVPPFNKDQQIEKYKRIIEDTNNYVQVELSIDAKNYSIKRYIQESDIFIEDGNSVSKLPISRQSGPRIFSDWILEKLRIPIFEMSLGTANWYFGFYDLFRLLNYDQDTEDKKIYKAPPADNFITESIVVRKAIFEILLGISSADFFKKQDEVKAALKSRDLAKSIWENYAENNKALIKDADKLNNERKQAESHINVLIERRDKYLKENTNVPDKLNQLTEIQQNLVTVELAISDETIKLSSYSIESEKIEKLFKEGQDEISQLRKIIFTHDKLDLFKMEVCPFCAADKTDTQEGYCICGSKFKDDDYEKFVYNSSEYKDILKHKEKSIEAIKIAEETYKQKIEDISKSLIKKTKEAEDLRSKLTEIIGKSEFSGNSSLIEEINNEIIRIKNEVFDNEQALKITSEHLRLKNDYSAKQKEYSKLFGEFKAVKEAFELNNATTIKNFNTIYSDLLSKSSLKSAHAEINEDYMPFIDHGEYHQASAGVPRRLMYYFTILSMALKYPSVKHPRFLLIDTPENSGIDREMLKIDISLLSRAIELAKLKPDDPTPEYQVILTIGYGRLPDEFEKNVVERFDTTASNYILKEKAK